MRNTSRSTLSGSLARCQFLHLVERHQIDPYNPKPGFEHPLNPEPETPKLQTLNPNCVSQLFVVVKLIHPQAAPMCRKCIACEILNHISKPRTFLTAFLMARYDLSAPFAPESLSQRLHRLAEACWGLAKYSGILFPDPFIHWY